MGNELVNLTIDKMGRAKDDTLKKCHKMSEVGIWDQSSVIRNNGGTQTGKTGKIDKG